MNNSNNGRAAPWAALISIVSACVALAGCGKPPPQMQMPPVDVGSLDVKAQPLQLTLEHAAQLRGIREVEVRARVSGILLKRLYKEGARVRENELLFKIDPAPFQARVAQARAELGVQQANLQQALRERDRILPLYDQKLVSLRDRDNAVAAYESASAAAAAAKAALRTAELDLSYTDVRAPIGGVTSREARSEGSLVTAGSDSSLLTHIVQSNQLYVQFSMPESEAESLREAVSGPNAGKVSVRVLNTQGETLGENARIEFIAPAVGDQTGTIDVRAVLDNKSDALLPGQVVRARVEGVTVAGAFVIPKRAVMHGAQGSFVWVIGADDKVSPRPVQLGITSGNNVAVTQGLKDGERIVVDGILKVQPGALVKATPVPLEGIPAPEGTSRPAREAAASDSQKAAS
ncbi:MAG TPA: efflux RND transporter periplasmic adaptor subunit [Steroidobacteraceae bacterium]|nr:efflux RND transporter periplasmic adaptor subunit [Steroidobacteraceae bacterium]